MAPAEADDTGSAVGAAGDDFSLVLDFAGGQMPLVCLL